jgi:quercetin dioxygenase-like cupin family protein
MILARRRFLHLAGATIAAPAAAGFAWAQAPPGGPQATQILREDLKGQANQVQETVVTVVEVPPGKAVPWHMHPGAQEVLFGLAGSLTLEVEGQGARTITSGETGLVVADVPHAARNESPSATAKVVVVHSRSDKDKPLRIDVKKST